MEGNDDRLVSGLSEVPPTSEVLTLPVFLEAMNLVATIATSSYAVVSGGMWLVHKILELLK